MGNSTSKHSAWRIPASGPLPISTQGKDNFHAGNISLGKDCHTYSATTSIYKELSALKDAIITDGTYSNYLDQSVCVRSIKFGGSFDASGKYSPGGVAGPGGSATVKGNIETTKNTTTVILVDESATLTVEAINFNGYRGIYPKIDELLTAAWQAEKLGRTWPQKAYMVTQLLVCRGAVTIFTIDESTSSSSFEVSVGVDGVPYLTKLGGGASGGSTSSQKRYTGYTVQKDAAVLYTVRRIHGVRISGDPSIDTTDHEKAPKFAAPMPPPSRAVPLKQQPVVGVNSRLRIKDVAMQLPLSDFIGDDTE